MEDKLNLFYNSLVANPNIKGLPDNYDSFKSAMDDPAKSEGFFNSLKANPNIKGLPDTYEDFVQGLSVKSGGIEKPQPQPQQKQGFFEGLGMKAGAGTFTLGEMVTEIPQAAEAIANLPMQIFASSMINKEVRRGNLDQETADFLKKEDLIGPRASFGQTLGAMPGQETMGEAIAGGKVNEWFEQNAEQLNEAVTRYDQSATDYLKSGQYGKALGAITYGIAESLPSTVAAMFVPGGAAALGLGVGAQKYDEIKDRDDMSDAMKAADAFTQGVFEWLFEKYGSKEIAGWLKAYYAKAGGKGIEKAFTSQPVQNLIAKGYKKFGLWFAPVHEGISETLTTMGQNASAILSGETPDASLMDNTLESFLIGTGMGGGFALTTAMAKKVKDRASGTARDQALIDKFGNDRLNQLSNLYREGNDDKISDFLYNLRVDNASDSEYLDFFDLAKRIAKGETLSTDQGTLPTSIGPLKVPRTQEEVESAIHEFGQQIKFGEKPLDQDPNPIVSFAQTMTGQKVILKQEAGVNGDSYFVALDIDTEKPVFIKASDVKERKDIPYQEWFNNELNNYAITKTQADKMAAQSESPFQKGQKIEYGGKQWGITDINTDGSLAIDEITKDGLGASDQINPADFNKIVGYQGAEPAAQVEPQAQAQAQPQVQQPQKPQARKISDGKNELSITPKEDGSYTVDQVFNTEKQASTTLKKLQELYPKVDFSLNVTDSGDPFTPDEYRISAVPKAPKAQTASPVSDETVSESKNVNQVSETQGQAVPEPQPEQKAPEVQAEAPQVTPEVQKPEGKKEPWQMTREEFEEVEGDPEFDVYGWNNSDARVQAEELTNQSGILAKSPDKKDRQLAKDLQVQADLIGEKWVEDHSHENQIRQAVSEGKSVPPEVLAEYPDLQKEKEKPAVDLIEVTDPEHVKAKISEIEASPDYPQKQDDLAFYKHKLEILKPEVKKELWQMTREEFVRWSSRETGLPVDKINRELNQTNRESWETAHKIFVKGAIKRGEPVPPEILAEYPDLQKEVEKPQVDLIKANDQVDSNPSQAQIEAGNAQKGHLSAKGLDITLENAAFTVRKNKPGSKKKWAVLLKNSYGYFRRTKGKDGDQVDVFMGDNLNSDKVFVVDQVNPDTKDFDEHKVMFGFNDIKEAENAYYSNYEDDWDGLGAITEMPIDEFKKWLGDGTRTKIPVDNSITVAAEKPKPAAKPTKSAKPKKISRTKRLVNSPAQSFEEAALQFFVKGGRVRTQDFVRYTGISSKDKEFRSYIWAIKNDGVHMDVFHEALENSFGMEDKGPMDMINEIVDILMKYPGRSSMMDALEKYQSDQGQIPDHMQPEEDIPLEADELEPEIIEVSDDIMDDQEVRSIFKEYTDETGSLNVDKLLEEINFNPGFFTTFPFSLREDQLHDLKTRLQDEQQSRKRKDQESSQRADNPQSKDTKENSDGSNQGNETRPGTAQAEQKPAGEQPKVTKPGYGESNKIVTAEAAQAARERLRRKLSNLNVGMDPEIVQDGTILAVYHIEAGARKFTDYAKAMIEDLGVAIKPFLKMLYSAARYYPEFNAEGMDNDEVVSKADIEQIHSSMFEKAKEPEKQRDLTEEISIAGKLGKEAFERGDKRVPAQDLKLTNLLKGLQVGQSSPLLDAWLKAWDKANLSKPAADPLTDLKKALEILPQGKKGKASYNAVKKAIPILDTLKIGDWYRSGEEGDAIMPFSIEAQHLDSYSRIYEDPKAYMLIMEHNYVQEGDLMTDPRIDVAVYPSLGMIVPLNFEMNARGWYAKYVSDGKVVDQNGMDDTHRFLATWMNNLVAQGRTITEENNQNKKENGSEQREISPTSIENQAKAITDEAENVTDREQAGRILEEIDRQIEEIDSQLSLIGEYGPPEGFVHEIQGKGAEITFKKDLTKFSKELAKVLGWEHDTDRKGKKIEYSNTNVAPAGGDGHIILWKPNSDYGVYISVPVHPTGMDQRGYYSDIYKIEDIMGWGKPIRWRITTKQKKYSGFENRYVPADIKAGEFAKLINKAIKPYDNSNLFSNLDENKGQSHESKTPSAPDNVVPDKGTLAGNTPAGSTGSSIPAGQSDKTPSGISGSDRKSSDGKSDDALHGAGISENGKQDVPTAEDTSKKPSDEKQPVTGDQVKPGDNQRSGEADNSVPQGTPERDVNSLNHVIGPDDTIVPRGEIAKIKANIAAIKLVAKLEKEKRNATPDEKKVLSQYTGWGGLAPVLDEEKARYEGKGYYDEWEKKYLDYHKQLKKLLTKEEFTQAVNSTINAHYTAAPVIRSLWSIAEKLGFKGGTVLEPAAGIGHFFGLMPESLQGKVKMRAYELDGVTGRLLTKLYPQATVRVRGYETASEGPGSQDLIITNVPFGQTAPFDEKNKDLKGMSLHNYFIAKGIKQLKPGGVGIFITSKSTMDNAASAKFREWAVAEGNADFIGAIRLPNDAFKENAGTEVTTDVVIFQKRLSDKPSPYANAFRAVTAIEDTKTQDGKDTTIDVNEYYANNPEKMLGKMVLAYQVNKGGLYSADDATLVANKGQDTQALLNETIKSFPDNIMPLSDGSFITARQDAQEGEKEGTLIERDDEIFEVVNGELVPVEWGKETISIGQKKHATKTKVAQDYLKIKQLAKDLLATEMNPASTDADVVKVRKDLNSSYDDFVKKYGKFNRNSKVSFLDEDSEFNIVASLEDIKTIVVPDKNGRYYPKYSVVKSEVFDRRMNYPTVEPVKAENVLDALNISISYRGGLDLDYIASLTGNDTETAKAQLLDQGLAFINPATSLLEDRDTYLSGYVRTKLKVAQELVEENPEYQKNVDALREVMPKDIPGVLIKYKLGSPWIPGSIIEKFAKETLDVNCKITFSKATGNWLISNVTNPYNAKNQGTYATTDFLGHVLLGKILNIQSPLVTKKEYDYSTKKYVDRKDPEATAAAQGKMDEISDLFMNWMPQQKEDLATLETIYNETYNDFVEKKYTKPAFQHYPGANHEISLREHQSRAVSRILKGSTLLAHQVGTGKTFTMITAAMEMRRLGIAKKPMIVVQNSTLTQFGDEFKKLYPASKILIPTKGQMESDKRQKLLNKIAFGDWDAVIIPQSFLNFIPDDPKRERAYIEERIAELEEVQADAKKENDDEYRNPVLGETNKAIKALQESLAKLDEPKTTKKTKKVKDKGKANLKAEAKLKSQMSRRRDDVVMFEQMGVDAMFVDEAHAYKKLGFATKQVNVRGIDTGGSQRAFGLYMKTRYVQEKMGKRNVIFSTGTPITNTMAEVWTMIRFLSPETLKAYRMERFDDFARTFGSVEPSLEFNASGNFKLVNRFKSYINAPELLKSFHSVADVVLTEDVAEFKESGVIPKLKGGDYTKIIIPQSEALKAQMDKFKKILIEWEALPGKEKRQQRHIPVVIFGQAKQAAIDLRLLHPDNPDDKDSKANHVISEVKRIYDNTNKYKGTQLVFSDMYQSPKRGPEGKRFNLYEDIKKKLVASGIPAKEIEIISDQKGTKLEGIFQAVRDGDIRVLLGSTERMGTGVNVQDLLAGLHHIDAPHMPKDFEQRNGRILRQGNTHALINEPVEIITYGVQKTLDATAYQRLSFKQKFINQMMKGDNLDREMNDDTDENTSDQSFDYMMSQLSGNQHAMAWQIKSAELKKLQTAKANFERGLIEINILLNKEKGSLDLYRQLLSQSKKNVEEFKQAFPDNRIKSVTINGIKATITEKAMTTESSALESMKSSGKEDVIKRIEVETDKYLQYKKSLPDNAIAKPFRIFLNDYPVPLEAKYTIAQERFYYELAPEGTISQSTMVVGSFNSGVGLLNSLYNQLKAYPEKVPHFERELRIMESNIPEYEKQLNRTFDRQEKLDAVTQEVATLEVLMQGDNKKEVEAIKNNNDIKGDLDEYNDDINQLEDDSEEKNEPQFRILDEQTPLSAEIADLKKRIQTVRKARDAKKNELANRIVSQADLFGAEPAGPIVNQGNLFETRQDDSVENIKRVLVEYDNQLAGMLDMLKKLEATGTTASRESRGQQTLFRISDSVYFSPIEKALEAIKQEKGTPQQWKAMLLKGGAKQAELDWMGWDDLAEGKNSLTKADIQSWIDLNKVEIQEVYLGGTVGEGSYQKWEDLPEDVQFLLDRYEFDFDNDRLRDELNTLGYEIRWDLDSEPKIYKQGITPTKYEKWTIPGGEDYTELLLTIPKLKEQTGIIREIPEPTFHSQHWHEPNIAVHVRYNTRTTTDGKKGIFIEEIQSDWAQRGKKTGFKGTFPNEVLSAAIKGGMTEEQARADINHLLKDPLTTDERPTTDQWDRLEKATKDSDLDLNAVFHDRNILDMPFKQTDQWAGLAMRRMIRHAIDQGYDFIAWTPGQVQNERYNLSKQVNEIRHKKSEGSIGEQSYDIMVLGKDNNIIYNTPTKESKLEEFVGKETAQKIIKGEGEDEYFSNEPNLKTGSKLLKGLDLEVGGYGMKGFYDQILPSIANKIGKRFGSQVTEGGISQRIDRGLFYDGTDITDADGNTVLNDASEDQYKDLVNKDKDNIISTHVLPITESMFNSYRQGIPLFKTDQPTGKDLFREIAQGPDQTRWEREMRGRIDLLSSSFKTPVTVVNTKADLPKDMQGYLKRKGLAGKKIAGAFDPVTGTVYVVLDDIRGLSQERAISEVSKTILHEVVAHKGLPYLLGEANYDALLFDIYYSMSQEEISRLERIYNTTNKKTIAQEYLGHIAEDGIEPTLFQRILAKIRQLIRRLFKIDYSTGDIRDLLRQSKENLRNQSKPKASDFGTADEYIDGLNAWHGSSHGGIRRFSSSYVGTGEGSQLFGFGLYFSSKKEVADYYAKSNADMEKYMSRAKARIGDRATNWIDKALLYGKWDNEEAVRFLEEKLTRYSQDPKLYNRFQKSLDYLKAHPLPKNRYLYHVMLSKGKYPSQMDWINSEKPLTNAQTVKIADQLTKEGIKDARLDIALWDMTPAMRIYEILTKALGTNKEASMFLSRAGIDGMRYPIGTIQDKKTEGFNYVVFNDDVISVKDRYSFKITDPNSPNKPPSGPPVNILQKKGDKRTELWQNRMLSVREWQNRIKGLGGKLTEISNPYRQENLSHGIVKKAIENFDEKYLQQLEKAASAIMAKTGMTYDQLNEYMMAKHAPERNLALAIQKMAAEFKMPYEDFKAMYDKGTLDTIVTDAIKASIQSGMSTEDAEKIVEKYESRMTTENINDFWKAVKEATTFSLDRWLADGFINIETYANIKKMYQYYVPLRNWKKTEADSMYEYQAEDIGKSVNPLRRAKGRKSLADDPMQYIVNMAHTAIVMGEKNRIKQHAARLVRDNKGMEDLHKFKKVYAVWDGTLDADGKKNYVEVLEKPTQDLWDKGMVKTQYDVGHVKGRPMSQASQHEVDVYFSGDKYSMVLPADVANALNKTPSKWDDVAFVLREWKIGQFTRWLSFNFTSKNPAFIVLNQMRDLQYATLSHFIRGDSKDALDFMAVLPKARKAIIQHLNGKGDKNDPIYKHYINFLLNGGETGYVHLKDVDQLEKEIKRDLSRLTGTNSTYDKTIHSEILRNAGLWLEHMAVRSENLSRFSTYLVAKQQGLTDKEAAFKAKEITVNFNRKGRISGLMGSLFAFFNASVQGGENVIRMGKENTGKFFAIGAAGMALGFFSALFNSLWGGDDEDGLSEYDGINDYLKFNNLIIMIPGPKKYITIPLPHGFRWFNSLGVLAYQSAFTDDKRIGRVIKDGLSNAFSAISPVNPVEFLDDKGSFTIRPAVPTTAMPFYDIAVNQKFTGAPVHKDPFTQALNGRIANSALGMNNVNSLIKGITDNLFRLGGGDPQSGAKYYEDENGKIVPVSNIFDKNPSDIEHVIEYYLGGRGQFWNDAIKLSQNILEASHTYSQDKDFMGALEEINMNEVPVMKSLVRQPWKKSVYTSYYDIVDDIENYKSMINMKNKSLDPGEEPAIMSPEYQYKSDLLKDVKKDLKTINEDIQGIQDPKQVQELKDVQERIMRNFIEAVTNHIE